MGEIRVMGKQGDIVVEWDPDDPKSVAQAKEEWNRLKADGYEFYEPVETKGKRVKRFDKRRGKVIAAPGVKKPKERKQGKRPKAMAGGPNARLMVPGR